MLKKYIYIFLISMVPLIELRGAVPVSQVMGLPIVPSFIVCIIANMLPVPIIYLFARKVLIWGADKPIIGRFFSFCQSMIPPSPIPGRTAIHIAASASLLSIRCMPI